METECRTKPRPGSFREFLLSWYFWKPVAGILAGAFSGYLLYFFIGCGTGACTVDISPLGSILTGGTLGFLVSGTPCLPCARR